MKNEIPEAQEALTKALTEWRDSGGSIEDVVLAVGDLAREMACEIIEKRLK